MIFFLRRFTKITFNRKKTADEANQLFIFIHWSKHENNTYNTHFMHNKANISGELAVSGILGFVAQFASIHINFFPTRLDIEKVDIVLWRMWLWLVVGHFWPVQPTGNSRWMHVPLDWEAGISWRTQLESFHFCNLCLVYNAYDSMPWKQMFQLKWMELKLIDIIYEIFHWYWRTWSEEEITCGDDSMPWWNCFIQNELNCNELTL